MTCIKNEIIKEAVIDVMPAERIVTSVHNIYSCDLYKCTVADTEFTSSFELTCNDDTTVTTFVGYFDTIFQQENASNFSTGPFTRPTHWKQTLFHLRNPILCKKGCSVVSIFSNILFCKRSCLTCIFLQEKY